MSVCGESVSVCEESGWVGVWRVSGVCEWRESGICVVTARAQHTITQQAAAPQRQRRRERQRMAQ